MEERYFVVAILTVKLLVLLTFGVCLQEKSLLLEKHFPFFWEEGDGVLMEAWIQTLINSTVPS